ncbi:hypothetical protein ACFV1W_22670 [Kitasatospora sp. NPDC059648]|uniref:hypothetical protein n=1 Tax=Kitasatospora sp. NPDC059648 TaxID=3346894 RepID=UPI0036CB9346
MQLIDHRWAQVIEGRIVLVSPTRDHENVAAKIRRQLDRRVDELGCISGSGNLDLPGSPNWYLPDLAVKGPARPAAVTSFLDRRDPDELAADAYRDDYTAPRMDW